MERKGQLIVVRVDAAKIIGTGHVMRCLALAGALRTHRATVVFICRPHDGHFCEFIESQGFKVVRLSEPRLAPQYPEEHGYESWLGATTQDDAHETLAAIRSLGDRAAWLVVDHYGADEHWERAVGAGAERVLAIDDIGRKHASDLVLDQNILDPGPSHIGTGREAPVALLGPTYALLAPGYAELHPRIPARHGVAKSLFVFLGDAGPVNVTGKVLRALLVAGIKDVRVDVVMNRNSPHMADLQSLAAGHGNITLHHGLPTLAPLMARADLGIGAGGSNSWERLCLGLPTAIVTVADNQKSIADTLHRHHLALRIGHHDEYTEAELAKRFRDFLTDKIDSALSSRCRKAVDGRGARRVSALMMLDENTRVTARHATPADGPFVKEMLGGAFDEARFSEALRDIAGEHVFIVETTDGISLGYVRFTRKDHAWHLTHCLHSACAEPARPRLLEAAVLALRLSEADDVQFAGVTAVGGQAESHAPHACWRINICSDKASWMNVWIAALSLQWVADGHHVSWSHNARRLPPADVGFYLSYGRIVDRATLDKNTHNLVVHASELPKGRGWSPLSWQILEGRNTITATLFEAAESVDSGAIYRQEQITFDGSELVDALRTKLAMATLNLCRAFVARYPDSAQEGREQQGEPSFYPKRTPIDSRLDPDKTLAEQFNHLRIADNASYPAFFEYAGRRYTLRIDEA